ncbi:glycosyltransferase [Clostridium perfringens]
MKKDNKILFMTHRMSNGGAERIMSYIINGFHDEYEKYLLLDNRTENEYKCDCNVISINLRKSSSVFGKILNNIKRYLKTKSIKKELNIEKTISLLDNPNIINILTKQKDKVIISVRNCKSEESLGRGKLKKILLKKIYMKADEIIAISEGVKLDLVTNYGIDNEKIRVIYNPINIKNININLSEEIEDEFKYIFDGKTVINVGRLTEQKGQWHLIKAFSKVVKKIPNAKLIILGEGELRSELEKLINRMNLDKNVYLLGFQKNLFKYVKKADLFVLSSLYEGFGNVILEAMACGIPVISTDCNYGPREILYPSSSVISNISNVEYGEFGILVPKLSRKFIKELEVEEEVLADCIIENLLNNDKLCEYKKKLERRVLDFDYDRIVKEWIEL